MILGWAMLLVFTGCGINNPQLVQTVVMTQPPTVTVAPIVSMTLKATATLIPSITPSATNTLPPTVTPTPAPPTATPTITPIFSVNGEVRQAVNLRVGPGRQFDSLGILPIGTALSILSIDETRAFYLVQLDDGRRGWAQASNVVVADEAAVPVLPAPQLTAIAQATQPPPPPTTAPTLRARSPVRTDILAYCDDPNFAAGAANRVLSTSANVIVYWTWEASTPEQIQDQIDYGVYDVKLNDKPLADWKNYRTAVTRKDQKTWHVYWYVPVGSLEAGEYTVTYALTWTRKVEDGIKSFGPGGDEEANSGSCKFTVK
jgi:hypothetical protein